MSEAVDQVSQVRHGMLSEAVFAAALGLIAQGDGRLFRLDDLRAQMPAVSAQRVSDALRTLRDQGRVVMLGKGVYEVAEAFEPPRTIAVTRMTSGHELVEVGDWSVALTPAEAAILGAKLAGMAVNELHGMRLRSQNDRLADVERQLAELRNGVLHSARPDGRGGLQNTLWEPGR